ncbi:MAG: TIGR03617 family F420-dependent LLM class oxidoreductase [Acidimicrobiia bacterium]|nr:TIGR03617 family F420-dependent LLM class oxidoreductase [Acidimicrobiia bacterium]
MKVDGGPGTKAPLDAIGPASAAAERDGYDGVFVPETIHDPFVVLTLAAQATERVELGTKVAIAFARSPMALAYTANDIQQLSGGRLVLGLGTQVKAHIVRRFSMPWERPAARMREYVLALRAIWDSWNDGTPLEFRGEFFTHTLMNPLFCPPPNPFGRPQVMMAGVGTRMIEAAGEVADRFACHSFTSPAYLADVIKPALARGAAKVGRAPSDLEVAITCYVATGNTAAEIDEAALQMRRQVAFYGSTPAYTAVLDHHGFGGLHEELHAASRRGEWEAMGERIDDDMLRTYCVVEPPERVAGEILRRFGGLADRVSFYYLGAARIDWAPIVAELQAG